MKLEAEERKPECSRECEVFGPARVKHEGFRPGRVKHEGFRPILKFQNYCIKLAIFNTTLIELNK